jgi:hypothetical protein
MRKRSAHRDVHEQQPQRRVTETWRRLQCVKLPGEQERRNRHRRRLGDERAEYRCDNQNGKPPRPGRVAADRSHSAEASFRENQNGPRRRERHDDHNKHRFGEIHVVPDIVHHRFPSFEPRDRRDQNQHPNSEYGFDFAKEMQDLPLEAHLIGHIVFVRVRPVRSLIF